MKKLIILIFLLLLSGSVWAAEKVLREEGGYEMREDGGYVIREESISNDDPSSIQQLLIIIFGG
jgi:hypothetical protein